MGSHRDLARDVEEALLGQQREEKEEDRRERRSRDERGGRGGGSVLVGSTDDED